MANGDRANSPVLIPQRTTAVLSPADDPGNFAAIAKKNLPDVWNVSRFYEGVTSPESPLHAFISGNVREISYSIDRYRYMLMRVHFQNEGVPILWLRAEKWSNQSTIRFSTDRSKLRNPHNDDIMATTFTTLNFRPVLDLLHMVFANAVWSPTRICIGILHGGFGGFWVKPPSPNRLRGVLKSLAADAATIESVQHQFAIQHPNAKKVSLAKPEAWTNGPALSQPPSSEQDSREGPDSNPAGTKGKIAYTGSALPLSEEHLRGPPAMQSPNMNGAVADVVTDAEKNGDDQPRGPEINSSNVLASKPIESPTPYDPHRRSISRTRNPLSGESDERRPVQPANPASTPIPPKEVSTRIDEVTSILQGVTTTAASAEASGQGPQYSPPFSDTQSSPPEAPNLTGRVTRLGLTPMARGGYSSVWRGTLLSATSDGPHPTLQVALKVLHTSYTDESTVKRKLHKRLHVEMRVWAQLHHENVVRLLGHTEEPEGPGLVSISCLHGDVLSFLVKNPSVNREIICADVALGLQYLHEHKPQIIHGDLKGGNVLIDGEGRASICDFGLSVILDGRPTGHTSSNFGGSLRFLAPELLEESTRTVETDIYAYACTCIEILFDQEPYHQLSKEMPLMRAISNHEPPIEPSKEEVTFPSVLRILKRCWDHDRSNRPSVNLIIDTLQRCLYHSYRTNLGIHQGIGKRARFMCLPGVEQAELIWVDHSGLSIVVDSSTSFHRVPIYQRYHWQLIDNQNLNDSEDDSDASSSLSGKGASSSEIPPYALQWADYCVKFRLPYSSTVSYESYHKGSS